MPSDVTIRPFVVEDYPGVVDVENAAAPEYRFHLDEYRSRDERRPATMHFARWVAVNNQRQIVGVSQHDQRPDMYHPRRFLVTAFVRPEYQGQGVGSQLLTQVETVLQERHPLALRSFAREDRPRDVEFLMHRGYHEAMRDGGAFLRLARVDVTEAERQEAFMAAHGVTLRSLVELDGPERDRKLCDLHNALIADIPPVGERTPLDPETFRKMHLLRPDVVADAYMVAVTNDGEYVGVSSIRLPPDRNTKELHTGITGVRRDWRRRGIALALKWQGIRYAAIAGASLLKTWNASDNEPVLALNRKLGFVREPWRIHFIKEFASEDVS